MSGGKKRDRLSHEDRVLWQRVAATTQPRRPQDTSLLREEMARLMGGSVSPPAVDKPAKVPAAPRFDVLPEPLPSRFEPQPIEERTIRQLAKGRRQIDSRIDLHGMTQDRARNALLDFLQMAQRANHRIVLVITGKGDRGQGVLRQSVPNWLDLPAFAGLVNGYRQSHFSHGGEGALYVRLRRRK